MDAPPAWHARTKEEALAGFESTPQGLSHDGAARRLADEIARQLREEQAARLSAQLR